MAPRTPENARFTRLEDALSVPRLREWTFYGGTG